jgi:hypothetical protein
MTLLWGWLPPAVDGVAYGEPLSVLAAPVTVLSPSPTMGTGPVGAHCDTVTCADSEKVEPALLVTPDAAPPALVAAAAPSAAVCVAATPLAQPGARLLPLGVLTTWPMQAWEPASV